MTDVTGLCIDAFSLYVAWYVLQWTDVDVCILDIIEICISGFGVRRIITSP